MRKGKMFINLIKTKFMHIKGLGEICILTYAYQMAGKKYVYWHAYQRAGRNIILGLQSLIYYAW